MKMSEETIKADLLQLHELRIKEAAFKEKHNVFMDDIKKANVEFFEKYEIIKQQLAETDSKIRESALEIYRATGEKKLVGGLGIRVLKKLEYDLKIALKWAKDSKQCLTLDKKAFEKVAKATTLEYDDAEFVTFIERATATIPTKINLDEVN